MEEKTMFVEVRNPGAVGRNVSVPEVDADESVLRVVNAAANRRIEEMKRQAGDQRITDLKKREAAVIRRERNVSLREEKHRSIGNLLNFVLDGLMIIFSTIGLVASVLFFIGL